jgi:hypothetical protein
MTILDYLRNLVKRTDSKPELEYVHASRNQTSAVGIGDSPPVETSEAEHEVDLAGLTDLEAYARGSGVSRKFIEQWISSGLLMPEELKVAEKLVKMMNKSWEHI